jgi:GH15 family glucan-1,4-alpha-glucosidase
VGRHPDISDHGLIGDLQTAVLVTTNGFLDWFCCPRFVSPSVFAPLLDAQRGGHYRIAPDGDDYVSRQLYLPDTAILVTRFMTPDGVGEVHDFVNLNHQPDHDPGTVGQVIAARDRRHRPPRCHRRPDATGSSCDAGNRR